jgi:LysM repeat protein
VLFGTATDDSKNSFLAAARARKEAYDYLGAVNLLEKALEANPRLTRAHWDLGLLHYQNTHDYAATVYHLQKLLALDPKWKQAEDAQRIIADSKVELAKQAPFGPGTPEGQKLFSGMTTQIHQLSAENRELRAQLEKVQVSVQQLGFENHGLREALARASAPATGLLAAQDPVSPPVNPGASRSAGDGVPPGQSSAAKSPPPKPSAKPAPPSGSTPSTLYTVRKGDTAAAIARRYGITIRDLVRLNPNLNPARIKAGDVLRVRQS